MSGGIDSAACAHFLQTQGMTVDALFVDHGQPAAQRESVAVEALTRHLSISLRRVAFSGGTSLGPGEIVGRNGLLLFSALFVTCGQSHLLGIGLHAGTPYYDCSEQFMASISKLIGEYTDGRVSVIAPFLTWTKQDVFQYFMSAGLPITVPYSCEAGTDPVCGTCASCRDRRALKC